ncbi:MAG TPA: TonB-dependent receptor [Dysgonamonadaceae bacterium]|nr:TonB-dependent receptor [Dysgonamonadaceae bacterium]
MQVKLSSFPVRNALLASTLFLSSFGVIAEEMDSLRTFNLDSIVVLSIKQPNNKWTAPVSATTISATFMEQQHVNDMKDFSATVPNFIMVDRDSKLTSSVFIRGVGSLINTPGVAMYVDGVPHFEKSSFDINLNEIEKIEFLRGPQGTLYGRNAMGGIILVTTKSPFRQEETKLHMHYGSYDDSYFSVSHSNKISEQLAYGIGGNYTYYGGNIPNISTGEKADKLNSAAVNAQLEWRPKTHLNIRWTNNFEYVDQGAFSYGDINSETGQVDSVSTDHKSYYKRNIYDGGLQIDYHNSFFWLRAQTSVQLLNDEYNVDQDASPKDLYFVIQGENQRLISEEINIKGLNSGRYGWNFGIFAFNHDIDRSTDVFWNMTNPKYKIEKRFNDYSRGFALYHQSEFQLLTHLFLQAGIRYDYEHANSVHKENKVMDNHAELINEYDSPLTFTEWTPKASLQYRFSNHTQLYATLAKGYKTGGFNTVFETEEQRTFGPEKSWNYEIGGKSSFFAGRLHAEFALFYIDIQNQQIKQLLDLQGMKIFNAGNSVSKGFEVSFLAKPFTRLSFNAAYGYTHATFKNYIYSETIDYSGNYLPFVPKHTLSLIASYRIPCSSYLVDHITLNTGYTGLGEIYWNENNETKQPFYGLLNGSVDMGKGRINLSIWGKNLTDTHYLGYYFEMSKRKLGKPGKPFTAGVTLTYDL